LHRTPKLAAPTLLIVGEVVRQAYRASTGEESLIPDVAELQNKSLPAAFFQNFLLQSSQLTGDEEPIA
jgi:hypothetical protein